jgi:DNA-binding response OmpR family regulator
LRVPIVPKICVFMRVLVVEDYEPVRNAVVQALTEEGYAVDSADNGRDGLWYAKSGEHNVIVLDILLPHVNGIEILQTLRGSENHVPALLLTALFEVDHRIKGLDSGADDYLVKPFAIAELIARVRALLRRSYGDGTSTIEVVALRIDTAARIDTALKDRVRILGQLIEQKEHGFRFELLEGVGLPATITASLPYGVETL